MKPQFKLITLLFFIGLLGRPQAESLTRQKAQEIGAKVWKNECNNSIDGLTTWRNGERFASLGIGHFIWYPSNTPQPFKETFPQLIRFIKGRGKTIPQWIWQTSQKGCPWKNKKEFDEQFNSQRMKQLRNFLHTTIDLQIYFMVNRLENALPKIIESVKNKKQSSHIERQFNRMIRTKNGWYPLIDYLNFKGEGLENHKHYNNINWGLKQVLLEMRGKKTGRYALGDFAKAAKKVLNRRVVNAPKKQKALEQQWLKGWFNRIDTYLIS